MAESLKQIRQRVRWGIARAENAIAEFGGSAPAPPVTSALGHLKIAERELTAWIGGGVSDFPVGPAPAPTPVPQPGQVAIAVEPPSGPVVTITATAVPSDASIRYTVDGTDPVEGSALYTAPIKPGGTS